MNNNPIDIAQEYIDTIPQEIQDVLLDPLIETRISEISQKYGLNPSQKQALSDLVLTTLAGTDNVDSLLKSTVEDVEVTEFVAQQIIEDLETRVVSYVDSEISKKTKLEDKDDFDLETQRTPEISIPNYTPRQQVVVDELVQAPIPVPRFKAVPLSEEEVGQNFIPTIAPKPSAGGIMESKIKTVIDASTDSAPKPTPPKYSVDPYREPLA